MHTRLINITVDCRDVLRVASFWSTVLGRPLDADSGEVFASVGGRDPERIDPAWYFTLVPEEKAAKNRVHVDLHSDDPTYVDQLVDLGATVLGEHEMAGGHRWTVFHDPEGNEFCASTTVFTGWT